MPNDSAFTEADTDTCLAILLAEDMHRELRTADTIPAPALDEVAS